MAELLERDWMGNTLLQYLLCAGVLVGGLLAVWILRHVLLNRLDSWARRTRNGLDDLVLKLVRRILVPLALASVVIGALRLLTLPPDIEQALKVLWSTVVILSGVRLVHHLVRHAVLEHWLRRHPEGDKLRRQAKAFMPVVSVLIWSLGILILLDNLGFEITTLLAGLGIGGVAVALASQAVLGDLFSYLAIMLDRPFEIDDFILSDDFKGTVEHIGIKTTRLRSLDGEQLVFSNKDLTESRLRNYKRMQIRRVAFRIGLPYTTPQDKLRQAVAHLRTAIESTPDTRLDRAHFAAFGTSSLDLEAVYYVLSADFNRYMDIQQEINFRLLEAFGKEGIAFAFPTQTLHLASVAAPGTNA